MKAERSPHPSLVLLEVLYDAYHRQALGLAYRLLGNAEDAEEVVQEAFLSAWRAGDTYDASLGSTRTWFLSLVRHRCIDLVRAQQRRPSQAFPEHFEPADPGDVSGLAAMQVDAAQARQALAELPAEQRQVIELAYFSGLSHTEIATELQLPLGTVKGRIRMALDRLRTSLRVGGDHTALSEG